MSIWKDIEAEVIDEFAELLFSQRFWLDVKMFVSDINNSEISNEEKKRTVMKNLEVVFGELSCFMVNLAIELAVAYVKPKQNT